MTASRRLRPGTEKTPGELLPQSHVNPLFRTDKNFVELGETAAYPLVVLARVPQASPTRTLHGRGVGSLLAGITSALIAHQAALRVEGGAEADSTGESNAGNVDLDDR